MKRGEYPKLAQAEWGKAYVSYLSSNGMGMQAPPVINGNQIDLQGLFYSVIDWGGIEKVCRGI